MTMPSVGTIGFRMMTNATCRVHLSLHIYVYHDCIHVDLPSTAMANSGIEPNAAARRGGQAPALGYRWEGQVNGRSGDEGHA